MLRKGGGATHTHTQILCVSGALGMVPLGMDMHT